MADNLSELHEPLIEWVFDRSDGSPLGDVDFTEFGAQHGLDSEQTYTLLRQCKARGHLDDRHRTMGTPAATSPATAGQGPRSGGADEVTRFSA